MNKDSTSPEYNMQMVRKSMDYGIKKIIYHENAHVLFAYFFGLKCHYVDYTIRSDFRLNGGNIEVEFESLAHANLDLPIVLENYFEFLHNGGNTEQYISHFPVTNEELVTGTNSYLTILYAGYEAERQFFSDKEYKEITDYIAKYSQDYTLKNIQEDETKANMVLTSLGFSEEMRKKMRNNTIEKMRIVFKEEKMKNLFHELYKISQTKKRLSNADIESFLKTHNFEEWSNSIMSKINSIK